MSKQPTNTASPKEQVVEGMLRRMQEIERRISKSDEQFATLYLETVPRSFVRITHEEKAKRPAGDEPWTVFDHATESRITVQQADCSLPGCKCALRLVRGGAIPTTTPRCFLCDTEITGRYIALQDHKKKTDPLVEFPLGVAHHGCLRWAAKIIQRKLTSKKVEV
jgi:hypothetical protein